MTFEVQQTYPGDAAGGADYITGAAQRTLVDPDGSERLERIIVTPLWKDFEGRACLSETTVRHLGHLLGLYDNAQVAPLIEELADVRLERENLAESLAATRRSLAQALADAAELKVVYVDIAGREFASKDALLEAGEEKRAAPQPMSDDANVTGWTEAMEPGGTLAETGVAVPPSPDESGIPTRDSGVEPDDEIEAAIADLEENKEPADAG